MQLSSGLLLRLADPSDRWRLALVEARSFGWDRLLMGYWSRLDGRKVRGWVAGAGGSIVGYVLVEQRAWQGRSRPYVPGLGVLPAWRRRGCGGVLMRQALGVHRALWLHVRAGNYPARNLYARLGMCETARISGFYANGEDAIVVEAA
ncbi:MAG: GNAT family N-acetyltransferase [Thermoflexales bacterium]|nr:GNAT family N-acetyltransferase [Thermoflexales bacterium]